MLAMLYINLRTIEHDNGCAKDAPDSMTTVKIFDVDVIPDVRIAETRRSCFHILSTIKAARK